jgi:hypothetical protein
MEHSKLVLVTLLKSSWTDITKLTVSALSIVKTFNVIEHVSIHFISSQVTCAIHSLAFHWPNKTFDNGIVVTVTSRTHAAPATCGDNLIISKNSTTICTAIVHWPVAH